MRNVLAAEHIRDDCVGRQEFRSYRPGDIGVGEVEDRQLQLVRIRQLMHHHQHAAVRHLGDVDLGAGRDAEVCPHGQNRLQLAQEAGLLRKLIRDGSVKTCAARHSSTGVGGTGVHAHQVVRGAVNPPGVSAPEELTDLGRRQREHAAQVPARQREHPGLQGVEHRQQQMGAPDPVDIGDLFEVGDTERRRDDGRRGARDAVGGEYQVVRGVGAGERLDQIGADTVPEFFTGDLVTLVGVDVVAVTGRPVHQFVGQLIVVLQGMDQ